MKQPNILVIVLDTLRNDFVGPLISRLRSLEFVSYNNVIATSPWTTPSHASIFTGLYPILHGAHETRDRKIIDVRLRKSRDILSSDLSRLGYKTFLLTANPLISPPFGFTGFDYFHMHDYRLPLPLLNEKDLDVLRELKLEHSPKNRIELVKILLKNKKYKLLIKDAANHFLIKLYHPLYIKLHDWPRDKGARKIIHIVDKLLTDNSRDKKFIFINFMEVHEPYLLSQQFSKVHRENLLLNNEIDKDFVETIKCKYKQYSMYVFDKVIELMDILRRRNFFDNSLIIVTSDHGQLLGEYNRVGHGIFLYDELIRVPLLVKYPSLFDVEITESSKYISLAKLRKFILGIANQKLEDDSILYSDIVFAESYGVQDVFRKNLSDIEKMNLAKLEKYRIAVFFNGFKGIFNVSEWRIEDIVSYDGKKIDEDVSNYMKKIAVNFLKRSIKLSGVKLKRRN